MTCWRAFFLCVGLFDLILALRSLALAKETRNNAVVLDPPRVPTTAETLGKKDGFRGLSSDLSSQHLRLKGITNNWPFLKAVW